MSSNVAAQRGKTTGKAFSRDEHGNINVKPGNEARFLAKNEHLLSDTDITYLRGKIDGK